MGKILHYTEWQSASGRWHCNDVEDLAGIAGRWWIPARMMNMKPADYLKWVIKNFNPDNVYSSKDCSFVGFCWKNQSDMRKFKNTINKMAKEKNFYV